MCPFCRKAAARVRRKGFFTKLSTRAERIQRFLCRDCRRSFSTQTGRLTYREQKPHVDQQLYRILDSGVSQRRAAYVFGVHRTTVARKLVRLGRFAAAQNQRARCPEKLGAGNVIVFDEMETFEHTKCKPISIAIAVQEGTRVILAMKAASMPAKGKLAAISRKKYGPRIDRRPQTLRAVLGAAAKAIPLPSKVKSDQCPRYPNLVKAQFPETVHETFKGRRACIVGQGELKVGGFDPLFSLNHTCAMVRDNLKTLTRKTWCTTKKIERLQNLLNLYAAFHNFRLLNPRGLATIEGDPIW